MGIFNKIFSKSTVKNKNSMEVVFDNSNFDELAMKSDKVVMIDFWAEWCGPCRMVSPIVEEIANDYGANDAIIGKVNVDENPEISMRFGIRNIPTILFLKNGEVVDKQVGAVPRHVLEEKLKSHM